MIRTIVTFERFGDDIMFKLDDAPTDIPGIGENKRLDLRTMPDGGSLIERGKGLVALLNLHPTVQACLLAALSAPPGSGPSPLYFHVRTASADSLTWEGLYSPPHGFCALDRRWPIGRIAARSRPVADRAFRKPLRAVAVLSAAQRDGLPQLKALVDALGTPAATGIGVSLHVITGDQAVLDAAKGPGITAELIAPTAPGLAAQISRAKPQILHALCHGGAVAGVRTLSFAHLADFDAGADPATVQEGSLRMPVADLAAALLPCAPWLVVLSACDSADASDSLDGPALAHDIVSAGVPAVIGMRRLVDLTDANRFTKALYPEVFTVVQQAFAEPAASTGLCTVDWAAALTVPRKVLSGADPSAADVWTDPVLYVQDTSMRILLPTAQLPADSFANLRAKIETFRGFLATLDPATAPPGLIDEARARIGELEATLSNAGVQ